MPNLSLIHFYGTCCTKIKRCTDLLYQKLQIHSRHASRIAYYEFLAPSEVVKYETVKGRSIEDSETKAVIVRMSAGPINLAHIIVIKDTYPTRPKSFPAVCGTEVIWQVIQVGTQSKRLRKGDLVLPSMSDGFWTTHVKGRESDFDKVTLKSQLAFEGSFTSSHVVGNITACRLCESILKQRFVWLTNL